MIDFDSFRTELRAEIRTRATESDDPEHQVFTEIIASDLREFGTIPDMDLVNFGAKVQNAIVRISGYHIDTHTDAITLAVVHYVGEDGTLSSSEATKHVERGIRVLKFAQNFQPEKQSTRNAKTDMLERIKATSPPNVRVILITDQTVRDTNDITFTEDGLKVTGSIIDIHRYFRLFQSTQTYEAIEIDFEALGIEPIPCTRIHPEAAQYDAYIAAIPAATLCELYDQYGPRLLELNVRSFLQLRGKVNRGIRATLIEEPQNFLAYNNGISATVESIECRTDNGMAIKKMVGFQVVNGGQTMASIHHTYKRDGVDLSSVFVQAKITAVDDSLRKALVPKISRYSNTQNRVSEADFASLEPIHVEIERLSKSIWTPGEQNKWFYERARGQYRVARAACNTPAQRRDFDEKLPTRQKFTKTDLGKFLNSFDQRPHMVARGAQKNFLDCMERLKSFQPDEQWYKDLIAKAILFRHAERLHRVLGLKAYRAATATYAIALLSWKTSKMVGLNEIWLDQEVRGPADDTLRAWVPFVHAWLEQTKGSRLITEWAKREECWRELQNADLDTPQSMRIYIQNTGPESTVGKTTKLTDEDRHRIARVMMVPSDTWLELQKWGAADGELKDWLVGLLGTLTAYAVMGWNTVPSAKQAKHAVKVLDQAKGDVQSLDEIPGLF